MLGKHLRSERTTGQTWKRFIRVSVASVLAFALTLGSVPEFEADAAETVYLEDQLLYWRMDEGGEEKTIKLKTSDLPINFTYTAPKTSDPIPAVIPAGSAGTYFKDENPGSKKSYGDTLLDAGVIEKYGGGC
ncbi:MAG: hypothetical protein J6Y89_03765 [Lachnospiraceae bacterium]|nr:hypothetical protein [Lachnospiraceae bacterium]